MKLNFKVTTENNQDELELAIDVPEKYVRIGLESLTMASAIKQGLDKIKEALNESGKDSQS